MSIAAIELDVVVIGAGIAGLCALDALRRRGYRAILLESQCTGGVQSMASQGMIHGGLKYALAGSFGAASQRLADMPARWSAALRGDGEPDLRAATVLSREFLLWSTGSVAANTAALLASHALRGRVSEIAPGERPEPFRDPRFRGRLYRLDDLVVDLPSVVAALAARHADALFGIDWREARFLRDGAGAVHGLAIGELQLRAHRTLLCAGAGNAELLARLGARAPATQLRPLHQVLVKHPALAPLYGHCTGRGTRPRLSISSHRHADGDWIWYLGGSLAETGAGREPAQQIARARAELGAVFPWLDLDGAAWRSLRVDRAEPRQRAGRRPDDAFVAPAAGAGNVLAAWPTKLALAPRLADRVLELLQDLPPARRAPDPAALAALQARCGRPAIAGNAWDGLF